MLRLHNSFALGCHGTMVYPLPYVCEAPDTMGLNLVDATYREQKAVTKNLTSREGHLLLCIEAYSSVGVLAPNSPLS